MLLVASVYYNPYIEYTYLIQSIITLFTFFLLLSLTVSQFRIFFFFFFFFQAEDGIRDHCVTGVQTCALPICLGRMVGRDDDVAALSAQLAASRIVSIVGAGGIGKTTVAVAVGHHLSAAFGGAALFVDFGMLSDPDLVAPAVASMLGLSVGSRD